MGSKNGLSGWKLDAGQKGSRIIFKDYHKAIVDILNEDPEKAWGSGLMWHELKKRGIKISRASVIFYLNFLVDDGLATFKDVTGKGGHHKLYQITVSWGEVQKHIAIKVIEKLGEGLDLDLDWVLTNLIKGGLT